jgi:chromosome partitioning protein
MKIVSVINYKGGVGKTTVTANLAAELAACRQRVLLIDLDPQASLTFSFLQPDKWDRDLAQSKTIKSWFDSFSEDAIKPLTDLVFPLRLSQLHGLGRLDLIPSHLGLINVDLELAVELVGPSLEQAKKNYRRVHRRLVEGLSTISDKDYDIVLIDCPPSFNVVTKTAIVASQHILIPARPDYLSTLGINYLIRNVKQLARHYNECAPADAGPKSEKIDPQFLGVVFTMVQEYGGCPIAAARPFMAQTEQLGIPVFKRYIRESKTLFTEAPQYGIPVVLTTPQASSHREVISEIKNLVGEFQSKLGLETGACNGQRGQGVGLNHFDSIGSVAQTA